MRDRLPVGFLAGISFTVSLLISELSFGDAEHADGAKDRDPRLSHAALGRPLNRTTEMYIDGVDDEVEGYIGDAKDRETHIHRSVRSRHVPSCTDTALELQVEFKPDGPGELET